MDAARRNGERALGAAALRLAEAGVVTARGNSGMLFARWLSGFAEAVDDRERAGARELAAALVHAARRLYEAVERPVEGTMLTVVREVSEQADRIAARTPDLVDFARALLARGRDALAATTDALPALREAGVVDAGAKGFVRFLEGATHLLAGEREAVALGTLPDETREAAVWTSIEPGHGRYCTEYLLRGDPLAEEPELVAALRPLGSSLVIHRTPTIAKIHIHTDAPPGVRDVLRAFGRVETAKIEDMEAQHRQLATRPVAVVTDSTCDLPPEWVLEHDVVVVPMTVLFGEDAYLDQLEMGYEEFLRRLTAPAEPPPTTSQPAPAQFREAFVRALESADRVLVLLVSGALSGTLQSAQAVAREFEGRVTCVDSRSVSLGLGFLVVRAVERLAAGASLEDVGADLERTRDRARLFFTVETLDYVLRSGRVGAARAFLADLFDWRPILSLDGEGRVVAAGRARGRDGVRDRIVALLHREVPRSTAAIRFGIVHAAYPEIADRLTPELRQTWPQAEIWVRPVTGVLAAHAGPGAWGAFVQMAGPEPGDEGTNPRVGPSKGYG
jgi:DegV family protein with EDD domain